MKRWLRILLKAKKVVRQSTSGLGAGSCFSTPPLGHIKLVTMAGVYYFLIPVSSVFLDLFGMRVS